LSGVRLAVPAETAVGERRVAAVPDTVRRLVAAGWEVAVERGAGRTATFSDEDYAAAGARIVGTVADTAADLLLCVKPPSRQILLGLPAGTTIVSHLAPATYPDQVRLCRDRRLTALALELVPRLSRAQPMDVLSSQALVVGYRGALIAAELSPVFFPAFHTAAGTLPPAKVLVLGTGVAGLQAVATARRLGAATSAHDVRPSSPEEVASVGGTFLALEGSRQDEPGGYARVTAPEFLAAQRELLAPHVAGFDAVVTTALAPGLPAPLLLTAETVERMRPGAVVVDLAAEGGGNCALTRPGATVVHGAVVIAGPRDVTGQLPRHASQLFARNVAELVLLMTTEGGFTPDWSDALLAGCCVTRDGRDVAADAPGRTAGTASGAPVVPPRPAVAGDIDAVARLLAASRTVVVVPGYGLAVAQAHHALRALVELLLGAGAEVTYALHPVAGRLPGHLDLLLDGAGVAFEAIEDVDRANRRFATTDVVLVVGANDIVNATAGGAAGPAGSPLAGMPLLDVAAARAVVVLDRDPGLGYAGVANPLFSSDRVVMLPGDAASSLGRLVPAVHALLIDTA
jgi:NAD(P) transhydrogenase subunit alpha